MLWWGKGGETLWGGKGGETLWGANRGGEPPWPGVRGLVDPREPVFGWLGEARQVDDECPEHWIRMEAPDIRSMMAGGHKRHQMVAIENRQSEYVVAGIVAPAR